MPISLPLVAFVNGTSRDAPRILKQIKESSERIVKLTTCKKMKKLWNKNYEFSQNPYKLVKVYKMTKDLMVQRCGTRKINWLKTPNHY